MKKVTITGFCNMYFKELPTSKSVYQAFETANNTVQVLTGFKMFKSYSDFKIALSE